MLEQPRSANFRALLAIAFLRAALALAAVLSLLAAIIVARETIRTLLPSDISVHARSSFFLLLFVLLAAVVSLAWWIVETMLSFANVVAVRSGSGALSSISEAADLMRRRAAAFSSIVTLFAAIHVALLAVLIEVCAHLAPLTHSSAAPAAIAGIITLILAYFALVDWLSVSRLAAYCALLDRNSASRLS
jgi:hypothetical protein